MAGAAFLLISVGTIATDRPGWRDEATDCYFSALLGRSRHTYLPHLIQPHRKEPAACAADGDVRTWHLCPLAPRRHWGRQVEQEKEEDTL